MPLISCLSTFLLPKSVFEYNLILTEDEMSLKLVFKYNWMLPERQNVLETKFRVHFDAASKLKCP
jgi:hypothetical protein